MAERKLKQGMNIVFSVDFMNEECGILLYREDNIIKVYYPKENTIIDIERNFILEKLRKGEWLIRTPNEL